MQAMVRVLPGLLMGIVLGAPGAAPGADAEQVFESVSPGVVLIRDAESHGSGVVLKEQGRILTCFHVVNTPLPLELTAEVRKGGGSETMTFKEVELVSVHREYDLAIVDVKLPPGARLQEVSRDGALPATGSECFVIGNPGGAGGEALRNSISTGVIGARERRLEGKNYIQTTAAINPGNSGGALVNRDGRLVGIVSFVISETEGIGFAIPLKELDMDDFVPVEERPGDFAKAKEYEDLASEWYRRAKLLHGEERELALRMAYIGFRLSLSEVPNHPAPYNNLGNVYLDLGEAGSAKYYFQRASELSDGEDPLYLKMLGVCEERTGNPGRAIECWKEGIGTSGRDDRSRSECAENLAVMAVKDGRFAAAAYLNHWANHLGSAQPHREQVRRDIARRARQHLSEDQLRYLEAKRGGFSFEDLAAFEQGKIEASPRRPARDPARSDASALTSSPRFEEATRDAPDPGEDGLVKKLPDEPRDCCPAYGGIFLAMTFPELGKIGIFNVAQVRFDEYLPLPAADATLAAGGSRLVVHDPGRKLFHFYDLNSFEKTGTKISRVEGVTNIAMGSLEPDRVLVVWEDEDHHLKRFGVMDLPGMDVAELQAENPNQPWSIHMARRGSALHAQADSHLRHAVFWCAGQSPSTFTYATLDGGRVRHHYDHSSHGALGMPADPMIVVGSDGSVMNAKGVVREQLKGKGRRHLNRWVAAHGSNHIVGVGDEEGRVHDAITLARLHEFKMPFRLERGHGSNATRIPVNRLIHASAPLNRVAVVDPVGRRVAVVTMRGGEFQPGLPGGGVDAIRGKTWSRKLDYPAGSRIVVEDAPEGLAFDGKSMELRWPVPEEAEPGKVLVLISVTAPGQDEAYERVTILVR